jgi:GntR family transcriptional regulator, rspAB operon transcriptional repressor
MLERTRKREGSKDETMENRSATLKAYEEIRNRILDNSLPDGTRLTIRAMAELAEVSTIPAIQALHRLEDEGLVETFPSWGSRVITLDERTVRDRYLLREAVECQIARVLASRLTPMQSSTLRAMATRLDELVTNRTDEYWEMDIEFHLQMAKYTDSASLLRGLEHVNLFRLLHKTREEVAHMHIVLPKDLHLSLFHAIASGDPERAESQMRKHIRISTKGWLNEY